MKALDLCFPVISLDMRFGLKLSEICKETWQYPEMWQCHDSNKKKLSLIYFKHNFLTCFCIKWPYSCAHVKAENLRISKLSKLIHMGNSKQKLWAIKYIWAAIYKHPVSMISHFGLFQFLSFCHVSLHISDNLSPNLISRDIFWKKRSRAFIWDQDCWGYRLYLWRYWLLKRAQGLLT